MSGREAEAFNVGALAVNGSKIGEREFDFRRGNRKASVFEHLKHGPSRKVVSVALDTSAQVCSPERPR